MASLVNGFQIFLKRNNTNPSQLFQKIEEKHFQLILWGQYYFVIKARQILQEKKTKNQYPSST